MKRGMPSPKFHAPAIDTIAFLCVPTIWLQFYRSIVVLAVVFF
jgi:hypothetical protein